MSVFRNGSRQLDRHNAEIKRSGIVLLSEHFRFWDVMDVTDATDVTGQRWLMVHPHLLRTEDVSDWNPSHAKSLFYSPDGYQENLKILCQQGLAGNGSKGPYLQEVQVQELQHSTGSASLNAFSQGACLHQATTGKTRGAM